MDLSPTPRLAIAILVDGENLSKDLAADVVQAARPFGIRRCAGLTAIWPSSCGKWGNKAAASFQAACSNFICLEPTAKPAPAVAPKPAIVSALDQVKAAVAAAGPAGLHLQELNPKMQRSGFQISTTVEKNWWA